MATQDQEFIDGLILTIEQAEDPESVTNTMVAAVLDFLNKSYKDLLTNNQGIKQEKAEREAADAALQRTIDTVNLAIQAIRNTANAASTKANANEQRINTLINGEGVTAAIDTFNELKKFLEGVTNKETFLGLLNEIRDRLDLHADDINTLENETDIIKENAKALDERVQTLEGVVIVDSVDSLDKIANDGIYFLNVAGQTGNIMVVRSAVIAHSPGNSKVNTTQYMFTPSGLEYRTKTFTTTEGIDAKPWPEWQQVGQKGAGNLINVDEIAPKASGYYDVISAAEAVPTSLREFGRWITFKTGPGEYTTKQFTGSTLTQWTEESAWSDTGGRGTITGVKLNNEEITPDAEGVVNIAIDQVEVDESFSATSTNPVQNKVINVRLEEIERRTLMDLVPTTNDDGTEIHIAAVNSKGDEFTGVDIPIGSGGSGGEDTSSARVVLSASVDNSTIREGDRVQLSYSYDHQYLGGDMDGVSTGQRGTISIEIKNGTVVQFSTVVNDFAAGSDSLDITGFLKAGTNDITIKAVATNPDTGKTQQRTVNVQVRAYTLGLSSSYSLANSIAGGGYKPDSTAIIPFTVNGSAEKTVTLYLDGVQHNSTVVKKSGKTNGSFSVPMQALTVGRHNIQIVAEMQVNDLTLVSESVYIDILKCNALGQVNAPFIGSMITFPDGRIFEGKDCMTPNIEVGQFERLDFDFVVYDPATTPAEMSIYHNGVKSQDTTASRTVQHYTNRFTQPGEESMQFRTGSTAYDFTISVVESSISLAEVTDHMTLKLSAAGRSNSETNPGRWEYEGITTAFNGFDWSTNGWDGEALCLTNGANINIDARPFTTDATATGLTIEAEIKCTNVVDRAGVILECMAAGVGLNMTTEEASLKMTGGAMVQTKFAPDMWLKIAFVVQSKADNRLLQLYVNGIRDRAEQYSPTASLMQSEPQTIRIKSDAADVQVRNVRIYGRALNDDEILSNYMVDRMNVDDMVILFQRNDVLNDETDEIDIDKLRAQGKAVMRIVGDVDLVNQTNNKKFEIPVDVYYYSPYGKEYDFVAFQVGLRIQGTSSTTYPRKNYRIYFFRPENAGCRLVVNGVEVPDFKYSFKPGARPVSIFCLKADFSDSSSVHNSGAVRIVNDVFRRCGWLTPPQAAYKGDYDVRTGIDAIPLNLFYDNDGTGVSKFLGKYNFNNEKSESHDVYGFEGVEGFNDEAALAGQRNKCICLEFLDNSHALCLFGTANMADFDKGLEFRFKADKKWATADQEDRDAVTRLWTWVQSCKGNPAKFLREYNDYFINDAPFAWYVITDYFMAVDNRAKNMMLVTWDGIHWMFIPYDMDTLWGVRNDSRLVFDYTITFDTIDETQNAYCFAGHDSVLWDLVRGCSDKLAEVARTIRANMSTEYVLQVLNDEFMNSWSERVYNKDGEYKYILPLLEQGRDYLYALQGSRFAHRSYIITNRFALLDSLYCAGTYRADAFPVYFAYQFASDPRTLRLTASERFCFGYGMTNGDPTVSGLMAENVDDEITMTFNQNLIVNDPQNIYGASRIKTLDLSDVSHAIVGTLNLNNCIRLQELDASCTNGQNMLTGLVLNNCRNLRKANVNGLNGLATLDLSNNKQLDTFDATQTKLTNVMFAPGGKLTTAKMPATLQTLELRYLHQLTDAGLTLASADNITKLVVDSCPGIDWRTLLARCSACQYLRITGLNMSGNGDFLKGLLNMRGVDENGANVSTCRLTGRYQLTKYLPDAEFNALVQHFPELNILQPEWTVIKFTDTVADSANISNLDNSTGYEFDNEFVESAHVARIMAKRHRVMAKCTAPGEATVCPLDDADGTKYHDGTTANVEGFNSTTMLDEGDVMIYEPKRWCKGIEDFINRCHYDCYSSLDKVTDLTADQGRKLFFDDLELIDKKAARVSSIYTTLADSLMDYDTFRVLIAPVSGYKQVRWPAVSSTVYGAVFLDADNNIIGRAAANHGRMTETSYLFTNVPEGAEKIAFTCYRDADFSFVWLTTSEEIQAIEPDPWQTGDYLVGVYKAHYGNTQIRSISGVVPTVNISQSQFAEYCRQRGEGFCLINYQMHRDFARLFFAVKGTRDSSGVCGYGTGSNTTRTGLTDLLGMKDTIAPTTIGAAGCFYLDAEGNRKSITSLNALGMENAWGNVAEWMEGVVSDYYVWSIEDANDGARKIKSGTTNDSWIVELANGRNMDVVPVMLGGTETTHYRDKFWCSNSPARVVYRSSNNAYSVAGVSFAVAYNVASNAYPWSGSRLAFIGKIIYTLDVQAFKALEAIA